jgi:hypothetical protein
MLLCTSNMVSIREYTECNNSENSHFQMHIESFAEEQLKD